MVSRKCLVAKNGYPQSVLIEDRGSVVVVLGVIRKGRRLLGTEKSD